MLNIEQLSKRADQALQEAEASDGIVVSVATLVDLWYVTQTSKSLDEDALREVWSAVNDSERCVRVEPITLDVARVYETISLDKLRDPWDRFITATAMALELPLVSSDRAIQQSGLVEVIW